MSTDFIHIIKEQIYSDRMQQDKYIQESSLISGMKLKSFC